MQKTNCEERLHLVSDTKEFGHIRINAIDDEVVIQAGMPKEPSAVSTDAAYEASAAEEPNASLQSDAVETHAEKKPARSSHKADSAHAYTPTTLDDINSSKMSRTQKVIIVVAILAIIAFVVYSIIIS